MASAIPVANIRGAPETSRNRRLGALLDLSRGEPPLLLTRPTPPKESARNVTPVSETLQSRAQGVRGRQGSSTHLLPAKSELRSLRPSLTHGTQSAATSSRSEIPAAKSVGTTTSRLGLSKQSKNLTTQKQPTISKEPSNTRLRLQARSESRRTGSTSSIAKPSTTPDPIGSLTDRGITESPEEARISEPSATDSQTTQPIRIYPELDRYRDVPVPPSRHPIGTAMLYKLTTEDLPPPTPQFSGVSSHSQLSSFSASPSTRFSGSPGTGPYSRDTTPTSVCSQSPGFVAPMRLPATRVRQASPAETRPPVTRRGAGSVSNDEEAFGSDHQGLAAVREALTSSSSGSTVRAEEKDGKAARGLALSPPKPPSRLSSQRFKARNTDDSQSVKLSDITGRPVMRSPSPSKITRPIHNRVPSSAPPPLRRATPPIRPSRDATPDPVSRISGQASVVHRNSSSISLAERRQSGQLLPSSLPRTINQGTGRDRKASARPSIGREPAPVARSGTVAPSTQAGTKTETGKTSGASSPSIPAPKPKFSLFRRRTKSGSEAPQIDNKKKDKPSRKGPAAGTGHEGYGSVGAIRRRSSTASSLHRGFSGQASPSSEYLAGTVTADQFLLERMNPVIIAGGAVVENHNSSFDASKSETAQSIPRGQHSRQTSSVSPGAREEGRQIFWASSTLREPTHLRRPSDNTETAPVTKPTLTYRRSIRGLLSQDRLSSSRAGSIHSRAQSSASTATTIHADGSLPDVESEQEHAPQGNATTKTATKTTKSPRKWNLFGRSQATAAPKTQTKSISATIEPTRKKLPAFYTMIEPLEQDSVNDRQVKNVNRLDTDVPVITDEVLTHSRKPSANSVISQTRQAQSGKQFGSPPLKLDCNVSKIPQINTRQDRIVEKTPTETIRGCDKELPPIPQVAASGMGQTSPKSFSRPFNQINIPREPIQFAERETNSTVEVLRFPEPLTLRPIYTGSFAPIAVSHLTEDEGPCYGDSYKSDKGSLASPAESYSRTGSFGPQGSNLFNFGPHIAQIPEPSTPLGEDEVWDEFNDLLEDYPPSPTSSCGAPFLLEMYHSNINKDIAKSDDTSTVRTVERNQDARLSVSTVTPLNYHGNDLETNAKDTAFPTEPEEPVTPLSHSIPVLSDNGHHGPNPESNEEPKEVSQDNTCTVADPIDFDGEKDPDEGKRISGSSKLSDDSPLSKFNLRAGSMTVSKWLTFGHVLFSPVRDDLINNKEGSNRPSILVIDGLGNDDWSYYAAETYPAADFYNLSPREPIPKEPYTASPFPSSPPNHYQIQFPSHADRFPFDSDSFTALVLRFPATAPEAHYRNIISEAQRVLKPGGFIELSVLDVDLNNVGNRTRRAVRQLKEQITTQHPDFYLSSTADVMLRLLGSQGFADIKTCRVGVPAASWITNKKKDQRSLAEMMSDKSERGDENITQMVSKVGRWWYQRCYEAPAGLGSSVWREREVLEECERQGTCLKLMVCYARVPGGDGLMV